MKQVVSIVFVLIASVNYAQLKEYTFEQIDSLQKIDPKPVVVFIHADWCKICKLMENTTLKNKSVVDRLNSEFYFVKLDGEQQEDINYNEQNFKYKPTGANTGIHELAEALGIINGQLSYPTTCILNPKSDLIFQYNKSLSTKQLLTVLNKVLEE